MVYTTASPKLSVVEKEETVLATEDNLRLDLNLQYFPASLLTEFAEKIVQPYASNLNSHPRPNPSAFAEQEIIYAWHSV
jgi:hypothetical protein